MNWILHRPHLETLQIVGRGDRMLVVGHVAKAVLAPREGLDAFRIKFLQQVLADRSVEHGARMRVIAKQERDVEDRDFGNEVRHRSRRRHRQVERAELDTFDRLALGTERAGVEILNLVSPVGPLLDFARERVDRHAVMRVLRDRNVHLERRLR